MITRIALVVFHVFVAGLPPHLAWAEPGDPGKGKAIYERLCMTCHGTQSKGDGPAGLMMTPHPADFTSPKIKSKPDSELLGSIKNGRPPSTMSAFREQLSEQQIHDVLAYIRTFGK